MKATFQGTRILFTILLVLAMGWSFQGFSAGPGAAEAKISGGISLPGEPGVLDADNPRVKRVKDVQERHTRDLMNAPDVVGTAVGLDAENNPAIVVFTKKQAGKGALPDQLEGVPVVTEVTGAIYALRKTSVKPASKFAMPVPIGVSTGNAGECSSGTIGARVKDVSGNLFALSNNHVYALENNADIPSDILQPGLYDSRCSSATNNVIGSLYSFISIDFSGGDNVVDAAVAATSADQVGNATPAGGYGLPSSLTYTQATGNAAGVGLSVKKYGRTTGQTTGSIKGINVTVKVCYNSSCSLIATFVNQLAIGSGNFSKAGDSGSLIVTNDANAYPVGLLFAGGGNSTFANPIDEVLSRFSVSVDGNVSRPLT